MKVAKILVTILLVLVPVLVESRVHPPFRRIHHPQVLTRPPPIHRTTPKPHPHPHPLPQHRRAKTTTTTTTTTAEPPEVEEREVVQPAIRGPNYDRFNFYYDYDPYYGFDPFGNYNYGGLAAGGNSMEVDDDIPTTTTQRAYRRGHRGRQHPRPAARLYRATPKPTTEKPTTPEPEEEGAAAGSSGSMASGRASSSGYCFCTHEAKCPNRSVPRGGLCWNILSYFTNTVYQRCCYSPSVAKRYHFIR